jgi:hypothetical protein
MSQVLTSGVTRKFLDRVRGAQKTTFAEEITKSSLGVAHSLSSTHRR